jgi:transposase InsO family protein
MDSRKFARSVFGHSADMRGISLENRPSGRNLSLLSRIRSQDRQSVPGTARGARIEPRFLDHVLFWNSLDLERKLTAFNDYYNEARVHASLDGNTLMEASGKSATRRADISHFTWQSHCHGLVQLPIAA